MTSSSRWLLLALALSGCPKKAPTSSGSEIKVSLVPRPGNGCTEVQVGVNQTEVQTRLVGCNLAVSFSDGADGLAEIAMPPPSDASGPLTRTWRSEGVKRRRVRIQAPGLRDEKWAVDVEDLPVGLDGLSATEAKTFELQDHRYVVFVIKDTARTGVVYPFDFRPNERASSLYRANRGYCQEYAGVVKMYVADPSKDANERAYSPQGAIQNYPVFCSHTDAHVFAIDLVERAETSFDVVVEAALRVPRVFRLNMDATSNYSVVDITVLPQEY